MISVICPLMPVKPYDTQVKDLEESLKKQTSEYELIISEQEISVYINIPQLINEGLNKAKGDIIHLANADFLYPDEKLFEKIIDRLSGGTTDVIFPQFYSNTFKKWRIADGGWFAERELVDKFGEWDETILGVSGETFYFLDWCLDNVKLHCSDEFTIDLNTEPYVKKVGKKYLPSVKHTWPTIEKVLRKLADRGIGNVEDIDYHKEVYFDKHDFITHAPNLTEIKRLYSADGIYGTFAYGSPAIDRGFQCASFLCQRATFRDNKKKILCLGSGNGYEAVQFLNHGHDCYIAELYHPNLKVFQGRQVKALAQNFPFKDNEFDLLFSCEVMEHIPEKDLDLVLSEAKRVSEEVFFTIATRDDSAFSTHITIHNGQWWIDKFQEHGFTIKNAQINASFPLAISVQGKAAITFVQFPDGVWISARC